MPAKPPGQFDELLQPKFFSALYNDFKQSRQAKLKKFGWERTPYYKKFIKKPAIDKIVENRKRGIKNYYGEQFLIESLANRVTKHFY